MLFLGHINYSFELISLGDKTTFHPPLEEPVIPINLSLYEWLEFQANFPAIANFEDKPFHNGVKQWLGQLEEKFQRFDLFTPIEKLESALHDICPPLYGENELCEGKILAGVEKAIVDQKTVQLSRQDSEIRVFPYKVVYLDGSLHLIAEETSEKCLVSLSLFKIRSVITEDISYQNQFSQLEVDEFVSCLRGMSDNNVRLVLKIDAQEDFTLNLDEKFISNPTLFVNPDGDYIWAATLEFNSHVFEWLYSMKNSVEVLDPTFFKLEFIDYCNKHSKKIA